MIMTIGMLGASRRRDLLGVLQSLGLTTGLKLVLDAGDGASAPLNATSWLDRSGNGYDFFRGTTSGADATDPTFNGTVGGLSSAEYWSFDGGDFFKYDAANEVWMQNLHKNNGVFSICAWVQRGAIGAVHSILGTQGASTNTGMCFMVRSTNELRVQVLNAGTTAFIIDSVVTVPEDVWTFMACYVKDYAADGAMIQVNSTQRLFDLAPAAFSTNNAFATMEIGARGAADTPLPATSRMGMLAMWEGAALTAAQLNQIYQDTRGRYGV